MNNRQRKIIDKQLAVSNDRLFTCLPEINFHVDTHIDFLGAPIPAHADGKVKTRDLPIFMDMFRALVESNATFEELEDPNTFFLITDTKSEMVLTRESCYWSRTLCVLPNKNGVEYFLLAFRTKPCKEGIRRYKLMFSTRKSSMSLFRIK